MCEKCKYSDEDNRCIFYAMGSGNPHDMPCYRGEKDEIKELLSATEDI